MQELSIEQGAQEAHGSCRCAGCAHTAQQQADKAGKQMPDLLTDACMKSPAVVGRCLARDRHIREEVGGSSQRRACMCVLVW